MYRPEGLENPFAEGGRLSHLENADIKEYGFEVGADAMYKVLWKMAEESPTKTFTLDANPINCPSVSIPENK